MEAAAVQVPLKMVGEEAVLRLRYLIVEGLILEGAVEEEGLPPSGVGEEEVDHPSRAEEVAGVVVVVVDQQRLLRALVVGVGQHSQALGEEVVAAVLPFLALVGVEEVGLRLLLLLLLLNLYLSTFQTGKCHTKHKSLRTCPQNPAGVNEYESI